MFVILYKDNGSFVFTSLMILLIINNVYELSEDNGSLCFYVLNDSVKINNVYDSVKNK